MVACVGPADIHLDESLNTLRYANRARNIVNKPLVNREMPSIGDLRLEIETLQAQLAQQSTPHPSARALGADPVNTAFGHGLQSDERMCVAAGGDGAAGADRRPLSAAVLGALRCSAPPSARAWMSPTSSSRSYAAWCCLWSTQRGCARCTA